MLQSGGARERNHTVFVCNFFFFSSDILLLCYLTSDPLIVHYYQICSDDLATHSSGRTPPARLRLGFALLCIASGVGLSAMEGFLGWEGENTKVASLQVHRSYDRQHVGTDS
jgi:hypothetical protein